MIWNRIKSAKAFSRMLGIFSILLLPAVVFSADRAKNIPGIDPLPLATGSGDISQTQSNLNQDNSLRQTSVDLGFPKVRNITVVPEPTQPFSAKISWDLYPDASTPVYVVRYSKPISTKELLLEAYNLTSPPLSAGSTVFLNRDLPEGVYYYAVVTAFELSRDGRVEMRAGQNYTISPFIVYRDGQPQNNVATDQQNMVHAERNPDLKPDDFYIKSLTVINNTNGVVLNWPALTIRGIEYEVFRGVEPLDSNDRIEKAVRLGIVREDTPFLTDEAAIEGKQVYYGVSVRDKITNKTYRDLKYQLSYIAHTYRKPVQEFRYDSFLPDSLTGFLVSSDTIQLIWVDPGPTITSYRVYRNTMPISSTQVLQMSEQIGSALPSSGGFRDTKLPSGTYFYAVLPNTTSGEQLSVLQPGRTFTTFGVSLRGAATDKPNSDEAIKTDEATKSDEGIDLSSKSVIKDLDIRLSSARVNLTWSLVNQSEINRIRLYRSSQPMKTVESANEIGKIIDDVATTEQELNDTLSRSGSYYYGAYEYDPKTKEKIQYYFFSNPIVVTEKDVTTKNEPINENTNKVNENYSDQSLESILAGPFAKEQYKEAEALLEEYLADSSKLSKEQQSKATFYLGITKFRLGKYSEAKKIFEDPLSIAHDRERASFWYRVSVERIHR